MCLLFLLKNRRHGDFPGGAVVENLPANAGDMGSGPGPGGSHMPRSSWARVPQLLSLRVWSLCSATRATKPRAPQLLSLHSGALEPQLLKPACLEPVLRSRGGHRSGRPAHRDEGWPPLAATAESRHTATKTQRSQK